MSELGQLRRDLMGAGDAQVARVVAVVDRMTDRVAAEALLAPLRPRLALLRPRRALSFTRLLFLPLDPLIVPAPSWRLNSPGVPRSILAPLAASVHAALGERAAAIDAMVDGSSTADAAVLERAGAMLWPAAGALLRECPPPADWVAATGLPVALYAALARPIAALLAEGATLLRLSIEGEYAPPALAEEVLRRASAAGAGAMALALLLLVLPGAKELLLLADDLAAKSRDEGRSAPERALEFLLDGAGRPAPAASPAVQAAEHMRRAALLLEALSAEAATTQRGGRSARVAAVRRQLDETCRQLFGAAAEQLALPADGGDPASSMAAVESGARDLRRLDAVGRRLGDAAAYDRGLHAAAARLAAAPHVPSIDRLRLLEILLGPEAALAMAAG